MKHVLDEMEYRENRTWTIGEMLEQGDVKTGISSDVKERFECYAIGIQNGFLSKDEVRKLEGLPERAKMAGVFP